MPQPLGAVRRIASLAFASTVLLSVAGGAFAQSAPDVSSTATASEAATHASMDDGDDRSCMTSRSNVVEVESTTSSARLESGRIDTRVDCRNFATFGLFSTSPSVVPPEYMTLQNAWLASGSPDVRSAAWQRFELHSTEDASINPFGESFLNDFTGTWSHDWLSTGQPQQPTFGSVLGTSLSASTDTGSHHHKGSRFFNKAMAKSIMSKGWSEGVTTVAPPTFATNGHSLLVFQIAPAFAGGYPPLTIGGFATNPNRTIHFGQQDAALFIEDHWSVRPNLTVSGVISWERLDSPAAAVQTVTAKARPSVATRILSIAHIPRPHVTVPPAAE